MGVYIKGMEMPRTGLYLISVDNTDGKDKTVITVMKANDKSGLNVIGSYELVSVPPHGDLIDRDALIKEMDKQENAMYEHGREFSFSFKSGGDVCTAWYNVEMMVEDAPTIIPAEEGE